jgi:hypothetical protein
MIQIILIFLGVLVVYSLISIVYGIVQLITSKGEKGLRNILIGVVSLVVLAVIGFGTCVFALNN